jgi:hypothetical protein
MPVERHQSDLQRHRETISGVSQVDTFLEFPRPFIVLAAAHTVGTALAL